MTKPNEFEMFWNKVACHLVFAQVIQLSPAFGQEVLFVQKNLAQSCRTRKVPHWCNLFFCRFHAHQEKFCWLYFFVWLTMPPHFVSTCTPNRSWRTQRPSIWKFSPAILHHTRITSLHFWNGQHTGFFFSALFPNQGHELCTHLVSSFHNQPTFLLSVSWCLQSLFGFDRSVSRWLSDVCSFSSPCRSYIHAEGKRKFIAMNGLLYLREQSAKKGSVCLKIRHRVPFPEFSWRKNKVLTFSALTFSASICSQSFSFLLCASVKDFYLLFQLEKWKVLSHKTRTCTFTTSHWLLVSLLAPTPTHGRKKDQTNKRFPFM